MIFVSIFPLRKTQEVLLEALDPLGKYERLMIRMSLTFLSNSWAF